MQLSKILEILIAIALVYFLFSTLVSLIFEWYSHKTQKRGRFLYQTILKLLNDPVNKSYGALLYNQYSISQLIKDKDSYPQYISSSMFADALIDIIGTQSESVHFENVFDPLDSKNLVEVKMTEDRFTDPYERFQKGVEKMKYSPLKSQLRAFQEKTKDYTELKKMIMEWFDDYMARVSGWYKIKTKKALFYISLLVSLSFNVDSINLIKKINSDEKLRIGLVKQAETTILEKKLKEIKIDSVNVANIDTTFIMQADSIITEIENNAIPIGYQRDFQKTHQENGYVFWFIGILISSFALSFGAPFWFEVMVQAINIRRAGNKPS
jgi:hypothetical protein